MLIFAESLIIETLELEALDDLAGYKEIFVLMEDLDQKFTAEAEIVTTPFDLMVDGKDPGVLSEAARGFGAGMYVQHLKKLDYLLDKAKQEASAGGLLDEFEKFASGKTADLNIIRPALMMGIMGRVDFTLRDWEKILNPEESKGQENFIKIAKMSLWHILTQEEAWSPLNDPNWETKLDTMNMEMQAARFKTSEEFEDVDGLEEADI